MKRRTFFAGAAGAGLAVPAAQGAPRKAVMELTYVRMRNSSDNQYRRTSQFISTSLAPATKRAGSGPIGLFSNLIGEQSPTILMLTAYASLVDLELVSGKLAADERFAKEVAEFSGEPGLAFQRIEKALLQGFDSFPGVEIPPSDEKRGSRVFELRIYESDNFATLHRKMGMFDNGEIDLFRKVGMAPVFFGETLIGTNMPNLTYMVGYDSLGAREEVWGKFGRSPEWQKMRKFPGLSDAEVVSNISNRMYRPISGSDIR